MNWRFKLSRRLSLLKGSIVALVMLTACSADAAIQNFAGPDLSFRWKHRPQTSASTSQSLVTASAPTVPSSAAATLTLRARDTSGTYLTTGGLTVAFSQSGGTSTGAIGSIKDSLNGVYTATFTGVAAGSATTIGAFINGASVTSSLPTISVVPGVASASQSTVTVSASTVAPGGTVTLTLRARDASGNGLTAGGLSVVFTASGGTSTGAISPSSDLGNGTYIATFTASASGTPAAIGATINAVTVTSTAPAITVTSSTVSTSLSTVVASAGTVASGSAVTLTLQAKDGGGVNLTTGGLTVVFTQSGGSSTGTISATADHADGTYTATFAGVTAGTARMIGATISGSALTSTLPTITVTPGALDVTTSTLTLASSSAAPGGSAVLATVHGKDAAGNPRTSGGGTIVIAHSGGTSVVSIGSTSDVGNGTYTAAITPTTAGTATTMGATIGGQSVTTTMPTFTVVTASSDEPADPGSGYVWADNFDRYVSVASMDAGGCVSGDEGFNVNPSNQSGFARYGQMTDAGVDTVHEACNITATNPRYALITGRGGSGKALRSNVTGGIGETGVTWRSPNNPRTIGNYSGKLVMQYWFRLSAGAPAGPVGYKWSMMWYKNDPNESRVEIGIVGAPTARWSPNSGMFDGNSAPFGYQFQGPYWDHTPGGQPAQVNDGQWHRWTVMYFPNTTYVSGGGPTSSRDGIIRVWIDGIKIIDVSASGVAAGLSTNIDLDKISSFQIDHFTFPGTLNDPPSNFTIDMDDFKVWTIGP